MPLDVDGDGLMRLRMGETGVPVEKIRYIGWRRWAEVGASTQPLSRRNATRLRAEATADKTI
jgi:hypothetical protein